MSRQGLSQAEPMYFTELINMKKLDHNVETGEINKVEMTKDEIAQHNKDNAEAEARIAAQEAKKVEKSALLSRLGITAEEAALLLS